MHTDALSELTTHPPSVELVGSPGRLACGRRSAQSRGRGSLLSEVSAVGLTGSTRVSGNPLLARVVPPPQRRGGGGRWVLRSAGLGRSSVAVAARGIETSARSGEALRRYASLHHLSLAEGLSTFVRPRAVGWRSFLGLAGAGRSRWLEPAPTSAVPRQSFRIPHLSGAPVWWLAPVHRRCDQPCERRPTLCRAQPHNAPGASACRQQLRTPDVRGVAVRGASRRAAVGAVGDTERLGHASTSPNLRDALTQNSPATPSCSLSGAASQVCRNAQRAAGRVPPVGSDAGSSLGPTGLDRFA